MSQDDGTPTIPPGHVPSGDQFDGTTPKYLAGFRAAVKRMMSPQPHQWVATYGEPARIEQLLQQAYQRGLLDGWSLQVPVEAPGPLNDEPEVPRPPLVEVWADLGLFVAAEAPPGLLSEALATMPDLPPLEGNPRAWAIRQTMTVLGVSLAEATDYVTDLEATA